MTIELVDGKAGVAHISSEDKAIIHQAKFSKSDVVFDWGDAFKCSMSSPNRATIGTGCASIQGLDWHITAAESVTISNGSQGVKRNDIICRCGVSHWTVSRSALRCACSRRRGLCGIP